MEERLCWWCCHPWEGDVVLHMPYKLEPKTHMYLTMGQFCSWNCVSAYNKDRHSEHKTSTINSFIGVLHKKMTGKLKFPKPAPSRYALKAFGGTLTIEEFRNLNGENIPIVSFPGQIHKSQEVIPQNKITFSDPSANEIKTKLSSINNSNTKTETLKLKRTKPLKRNVNNLETMMGLVITKK